MKQDTYAAQRFTMEHTARKLFDAVELVRRTGSPNSGRAKQLADIRSYMELANQAFHVALATVHKRLNRSGKAPIQPPAPLATSLPPAHGNAVGPTLDERTATVLKSMASSLAATHDGLLHMILQMDEGHRDYSTWEEVTQQAEIAYGQVCIAQRATLRALGQKPPSPTTTEMRVQATGLAHAIHPRLAIEDWDRINGSLRDGNSTKAFEDLVEIVTKNNINVTELERATFHSLLWKMNVRHEPSIIDTFAVTPHDDAY